MCVCIFTEQFCVTKNKAAKTCIYTVISKNGWWAKLSLMVHQLWSTGPTEVSP